MPWLPAVGVGTQTVFGEGPRRARVMLVGEQPGHEEDLAGKPFVGPAGRVLDRALEAAGIARTDVYVTNVVKHFKWVPKGKRRIHAKPNQMEIAACLPWLEAELDVIKPVVLVCLGATAAQALLGPKFRVTKQRGTWVPARWAPYVTATVHPSAILRAPDDAARHADGPIIEFQESFEAAVEPEIEAVAQCQAIGCVIHGHRYFARRRAVGPGIHNRSSWSGADLSFSCVLRHPPTRSTCAKVRRSSVKTPHLL